MKTVWIVLGIIALVVIIGLGWFIGGLNHVVRLDEAVNSSWAQVENQLQRRNDLVPNLVNTVKGYAAHEKGLFTEITALRSQWAKAQTREQKIDTANQMTGALSRLLLVAENYPQLKANQNFIALQEELTSTENKIAFSRQAYNDQVLFFNNKIQMFPSNIVASMFSFKAEDFFEIEDQAERQAPKVQF